jgi:hypothetical protein
MDKETDDNFSITGTYFQNDQSQELYPIQLSIFINDNLKETFLFGIRKTGNNLKLGADTRRFLLLMQMKKRLGNAIL